MAGARAASSDMPKISGQNLHKLQSQFSSEAVTKIRPLANKTAMSPKTQKRSRKTLSIFGHEQLETNHTDLLGKFKMTSALQSQHSRHNKLNQTTKCSSRSRFIPIEKLGLCSPIGLKRPIDKPMMSESEIKALERSIEPVFKDCETKGLSQKAINRLKVESIAQWQSNRSYLGAGGGWGLDALTRVRRQKNPSLRQ